MPATQTSKKSRKTLAFWTLLPANIILFVIAAQFASVEGELPLLAGVVFAAAYFLTCLLSPSDLDASGRHFRAIVASLLSVIVWFALTVAVFFYKMMTSGPRC